MNYRGSDSGSPLGRIRNEIEPLDLGPENDAHFQAFCDIGGAAEARAFLTEDRLRMLRAASAEFDIEITDGWIYLYAYGIEISWNTADRWAWVFSVASRLWDHVEAWQAVAGRPPATLQPPFYTASTVPRPADLDRLPKPSPGWQAFWELGDPHM